MHNSGKTCLISAMLRVASLLDLYTPRPEDSVMLDTLGKIFYTDSSTPAVVLPAFLEDRIYYFPISLNEWKDIKKRNHRLSIVFIPGDIFEIFGNLLEGKPLKEYQTRLFNQLKSYLESRDNPKYHFFLLDSKPPNEIYQMRYRYDKVLYYLREKKIFNRGTLGISLIVTKCDQLSPNKEEWAHKAMEFVSQNYGGVATELKRIVGDPHDGGLGLSDGSIPVIPFSIGEVFFQQLCLFDPESSENFVRMLMKISPDYYSSWNNGFLRRFRG